MKIQIPMAAAGMETSSSVLSEGQSTPFSRDFARLMARLEVEEQPAKDALPASLAGVRLHNLAANHKRREKARQDEEEIRFMGRKRVYTPRHRLLLANVRTDSNTRALAKYIKSRPSTAPAKTTTSRESRSSLVVEIQPLQSENTKKPKTLKGVLSAKRASIGAAAALMRLSDRQGLLVSSVSSMTAVKRNHSRGLHLAPKPNVTDSHSRARRPARPLALAKSAKTEMANRSRSRPSTAPLTSQTRQTQTQECKAILQRFEDRGIPIELKRLERALREPEECIRPPVKKEVRARKAASNAVPGSRFALDDLVSDEEGDDEEDGDDDSSDEALDIPSDVREKRERILLGEEPAKRVKGKMMNLMSVRVRAPGAVAVDEDASEVAKARVCTFWKAEEYRQIARASEHKKAQARAQQLITTLRSQHVLSQKDAKAGSSRRPSTAPAGITKVTKFRTLEQRYGRVTANPTHSEAHKGQIDRVESAKGVQWFPSALNMPASPQIHDSIFDSGRNLERAKDSGNRRPASAGALLAREVKPNRVAARVDVLHEMTQISRIKTHFLV